jgi:23S rRNA pseudouridine1911/1915/1917 synthase
MPIHPESGREARSLVVENADSGARLDAFLAAHLTGAVSRARIQRAIASGDILVNDREVKPSYKVREGDSVQVELPPTAPLEAVPEDIPLEILYEDGEIVVVNKPAGMVIHPGAGIDSGTLANALAYHFTQLSGSGGRARPGIVHRLDVGTSGLVVVAKTDRAHLKLAEQFEARSVFKSYLALVYGTIKEREGRIEAPITRDPHHRVKMAVRPEGRSALTLYRLCRQYAACALLEVEIKTGRTHQIRVHLAHIKHPVVGDSTYDSGRSHQIREPGLRAAVARLHRPFLHASRLSFDHPASGERLELMAPLAPELESVLSLLAREA